MPTQKRITSDSVYVPTGGINKTNSLGLRKDEALDIINMRPTPAGLVTREGTTRFSAGTMASDPILHFHTYKSEASENIPFAFTKNNIFRYVAGTHSWTPCLYEAPTVVDNCEGCGVASIAITTGGTGYAPIYPPTVYILNVASGGDISNNNPPPGGVQATATCTSESGSGGAITIVTITNPGSGYNFIPQIIVVPAPEGGADCVLTASLEWERQSTGDIAFTNLDSGVFKTVSTEDITTGEYVKRTYSAGLDLSTYNILGIALALTEGPEDPKDYYANFPLSDFQVEIKDTSDVVIPTKFSGFTVADKSDTLGGRFRCIKITFTDDTPRTEVGSIKLTYVGDTLDNILYISHIEASKFLAADVSFWSTTDFIEEGKYKIIAAGSDPALPYEVDNDGDRRFLLYLDPVSLIFKELVLKEIKTVLDEDTSKEIDYDPTGEPAVYTIEDTSVPGSIGSAEIIPGSMSLHTLHAGTLATGSAIVNSGFEAASYAVTTVKDDVKANSATSYIKETGAWSLEITGDDFDSSNIFIDYSYKATVDVLPRFVWNFNGRLLMGNTYEDESRYYNYRLRWTNAGSSTVIQTLNYHDLLDDDSSRIMWGEAQSSYFNIYKQNTIYRITGVADELNIGLIFAISPIWKDGGTLAGRTVQTFNGKQYFMGLDDVYVFDGVNLSSITTHTSLRTQRLRDDIFSVRNESGLNQCFGSINQKYSEYWLWIVRTDETYPQIAYVYSIVRGVWTKFEFKNEIASTGLFHLEKGTIIDDLFGEIDEQAWVINSASTSGINNIILLGETTGEIARVNENIASDGGYFPYEDADWIPGTLIKNTLITRDFIFRSLPHHDRLSRVEMHGKFTTAEMGIASTAVLDKANFNSLETLTAEEEYIYYFPDVVGSSVRIYIELTGKVLVEWIIPYAVILNSTNS